MNPNFGTEPMNAFGKPHYLLIALAAVVAFFGMYLLSTGLESTAALYGAPLALFLAYVVLMPLAILWPKAEKNDPRAGQATKP